MSSEEREKAELRAGAFSGCLVDGDVAENAREKKNKRWSLGISVVLQGAGLAALVIAPMLAKPAEMVVRGMVPVPQYSHRPAPVRPTDPRPVPPSHPVCITCVNYIRPIKPNSAPDRNDRASDPDDSQIILGDGSRSLDGPIPNVFDARRQPPAPDATSTRTKRVHVSQIDAALLTHRVEPVYPALGRQLHRGGKVELHAVIATDGTVQSLQVVSGDPLFVNSALEAVRQWHYKPTYLNGQPVEIDTFIVVIYTLQQ
jgi:TonB family protein